MGEKDQARVVKQKVTNT